MGTHSQEEVEEESEGAMWLLNTTPKTARPDEEETLIELGNERNLHPYVVDRRMIQ